MNEFTDEDNSIRPHEAIKTPDAVHQYPTRAYQERKTEYDYPLDHKKN